MTIGSNLPLRIATIFLAGFVLLQALVWAVMALPSRGDERRPYNLPQPAELRSMVEMVEAVPAVRRDALVDLLNSSLYTVRLSRVAAPADREEGFDDLQRLYDSALPGRGVRVTGRRPLFDRPAGEKRWLGRFLAPIAISVALQDGLELVVDSRPSPLVRAYLRERSFLGVVGGLVFLGVLMLAVLQTTRPLTRLSRGVRRLAGDLSMPDLPVSGSRDIRELSVAFNDMKARIGELLAERTRILAGIAHDMRTYLTRLRLRAEFIDDATQRAKAAADLDEMAALLDDTLLFAQRDAGVRRTQARIDLAPELAALVNVRAEMGDAVTLRPVPDLAIHSDPVALRRMLGNLIDNGVRHGGAVDIVVREEAGVVAIAIADDGPGVPADALARLGEPFGRLEASRDRETGGAGLGLAIVRALADRTGAIVQFSNRQGGGFVATLRFPMHAASADDAATGRPG